MTSDLKMADLSEVEELLLSLVKDGSISKNVREIFEDMRDEIKNGVDINVKLDAALQKVEDLSLDPNLSPYARTQIWNLTSLLESAQNSK